jgi:hypothetical protein
MVSKFRKFVTIITVLSFMAGAIFAVRALVTVARVRQLRNVKLVSYETPCVVITADDRGSQVELKMRPRVVVFPR